MNQTKAETRKEAQSDRTYDTQGAISDMSLAFRLALQTGCQNPDTEGHSWDPSTRLTWWTGGKIASSPKCSKCRQQWKARLQTLGWGDEAIRHIFQKLGAPITWGKTREVPSMGLEAILLRGGSYSDWKDNRDRKNPPPLPQKKLADTIIWVGEMTPDMQAHNQAVQSTWDQVIEEKEAAADRGEDPLAIRMPDMKVFRLQTTG